MHFRLVVAEDKTPQSQYGDTKREMLALTTPARQGGLQKLLKENSNNLGPKLQREILGRAKRCRAQPWLLPGVLRGPGWDRDGTGTAPCLRSDAAAPFFIPLADLQGAHLPPAAARALRGLQMKANAISTHPAQTGRRAQ